MITVRLYGLMRLESGIRELQVDATDLKSLYEQMQKAGLKKQELKGCCVLRNGVPVRRKETFKDGDVVQLLPPVAGG